MIVNSCAYVLIFRAMQAKVKRDMKWEIIHNMDLNDAELIAVHKVDLDRPGCRFRMIDSKEFKLDGKMYDIARRDTKGDSVYFYAVRDTKEDDILNRLLSFEDAGRAKNRMNGLLLEKIKTFRFDWFETSESEKTFTYTILKYSEYYHWDYQSRIPEIIPPPPVCA